ncbi:MAG: hypothetical protein RIE53_06515 [Rhodothermales bacterium]
MYRNLFRALGLCLVVLLPLDAQAQSSDIRLSVKQLKDTSESVVLARTVKTESFWNDDRSAILTRVTLQVEESLSGSAAGETVVIVPGGQIGPYIHEVSDMPEFVTGEDAVVFLERHSSGLTVVNGGARGKLEVKTDAVSRAREVVGGAALFDQLEASETDASEADTHVEGPVRSAKSLSLDEFKRRLLQR